MSGVYEGGLKIWECSLDLVDYIFANKSLVQGKRVFELGCGQALPAIASYKCGALSVTVQDFNKEVIEKCTRPVFDLNESPGATFMFGSWENLADDSQLKEIFDVVIMSETLYNIEYYPSLFNLIDQCLAPNGVVIVGTKTFYYGLGGGQFELEEYLKKRYAFKQLGLMPEVLLKINDLKSIERVILKLSWSQQISLMQIDEDNDFQL